MSGGSRQHPKEDLSLRLSGECSAEGRQGNSRLQYFLAGAWVAALLVIFFLCFALLFPECPEILDDGSKREEANGFSKRLDGLV